jgi:methylglutaconyl-CoA hydratase
MMIESRLEDQIWKVTLNRPEKHNAFDAGMIASLSSALQSMPAEARLVLITGNGKSFCAGADISYMRAQASYSEEQNRDDAKKLSAMFEFIYELPVPTVTYAQGNIFGGGLGILAACDIALAHESAKFCFSEVKMGIIPAVISPYVLRKTSNAFAKRYFLSAEVFDAQVALRSGLIAEVVPTEKAEETVQNLCKSLVSAGQQAQRSAKRLMHAYENFEPMSRDQLIHELAKLRSTEDAQARMKNFLGKTTN